MINVGKLLEGKGHKVWSIAPEDTVFEAINLMDKKSIGAVAVVVDDALVGILSERDYARKVILLGRSSKETLVKDIMTRQVYHTHSDQNIEECLVMMNDKRIRHLPVIDDDKLVGMISVGDVVKEIIIDQKYTIKQLEQSISWSESY